jgi:hypothetical protein
MTLPTICGAILDPPCIPSTPWECALPVHSDQIRHRDLDGTTWFDPVPIITRRVEPRLRALAGGER